MKNFNFINNHRTIEPNKYFPNFNFINSHNIVYIDVIVDAIGNIGRLTQVWGGDKFLSACFVGNVVVIVAIIFVAGAMNCPSRGTV